MARQNRLTKRQKRILREEGVIDIKNRINPSKFSIVDITRHYDLTDIQHGVIDAYDEEHNLVLHGVAGTGKTFLSVFLSLQDITGGHELYNKLYIVRSVVPTRDLSLIHI